jgi:hypothetical protein
MNNLNDLKDQLQEDLISRFEETLNQHDLDAACQIVVDRINQYQKIQEEENKDKFSIVWSINDVLYQADNEGVSITEDEARHILNMMEKYHDANFGISWETISTYLSDFRYE